MKDAISVTGYGIICSIGNDAPSVLESLRGGVSGIRRMKYLPSVHKEIPVGEVQLSNGEMKAMLGISGDVELSRTSLMGAIAVREALSSAGLTGLEGKRVALISGTTVGVMDLSEMTMEQYESNDCGRSTDEIARISGLGDVECCTVSTACSSALNAIILGAEMLGRDEVDLVIAGGSEPLSRLHLNGFNTLMILDRERCRPFDDTRAGLNLGEGAAYVVLEKGARNAVAYVRGYGNRCDAFHQTASSENGEGAYLAMREALEMAGLEPGDIRYVNAHGTGTPNNDLSESRALIRIFGENMPEVSSTKAFTGHTTSASGSIETVICLLAMQNGFTPANLGWKNPIPGGIIPTMGRSGQKLDNVLCNAFGFGGNDSSLVLSTQAPCVPETPVRPDYAVREAASVRICSDEELAELKSFLSPMETRRMGKLMKAGHLAAFKALSAAGIECPDAIISATSRGMLETSTLFLQDIIANGEEQLRPTLFMQSTHNTIGSALAIRTGCHGYNTTYSQGEDSMEWALRDAVRQIETGKAKSVLVSSFDEEISDGRTVSFCAESKILVRDE